MGGGSSKRKSAPGTVALPGKAGSTSLPSSPVRQSAAPAAMPPVLISKWEAQTERPTTCNENWRVTPRDQPQEQQRPTTCNDNWRVTPRERDPLSPSSRSRPSQTPDVKEKPPSPCSANESTAGSTADVSPDRFDEREQTPREAPCEDLFQPVRAEELLQLTQAAFGHMVASSLTSEKWDRRAEAIKGIEQMVKSQRLAGADKSQLCAAVRILEHALRDKVWPVLSASFALHRMVLSQAAVFSPAELDAAMRLLAPPIAMRLGDAQKRTHDAAVDLLFTSASVSLDACVDALADQVAGSSKDVKGASKAFAQRLEGVLDCVLRLIREDASAPDAVAAKLSHVFQIAADHPKEKVRSAGITAVAELQLRGLTPAVTLRPALQAALQARLDDLGNGDDDGEGEVLAEDFVVVGTKAPICREAGAPVVKNELEFADEEETMMDQILGDTGLIFQNSAKVAIDSGAAQEELEADFLRDLEDLGN